MKYWPLSIIATSPLMSFMFVDELQRVYKTCYLSPAAFHACGVVAHHTAHRDQPNLAIIESVNAPPRQVYTEYPDFEEWFQLERGGVVEASNGVLYVIIDALH